MSSHSRDALHAWFLGPRAENAELLERLVVEALRDHVFWRRNYHPEDGFAIRETDKRQEGYEENVATLTQELMGLLAELKRDVPFFSGRYKGHMVGEQTIASQIGYFATMLYNPNNIAIEISPVTTRLELEVAGQLAPDDRLRSRDAAGAISPPAAPSPTSRRSGWPASVRYLARGRRRAPPPSSGSSSRCAFPAAARRRSPSLPLWELLNVANRHALDLWDALWQRRAPAPTCSARSPTIRSPPSATRSTAGGSRWTTATRSPRAWCWLRRPRTTPGRRSSARSASGPTSWCMSRSTGTTAWIRTRSGSGCSGLARRRQPILALVSVCGTTEESAVDRLDQVLAGPGAGRARAGRHLPRALRRLLRRLRRRGDPPGGRDPAYRRRDPSVDRTASGLSDDWVRRDRGAGRGRLGDGRSAQDGVRPLLGRRHPGAGSVGHATWWRPIRPTSLPASAGPGHRALPRPVHPRRLQAGSRGGGGLAQPQGAAARRARIRLPHRAHGGRGPAAPRCPRRRGPVAVPRGHAARCRTSTSSATCVSHPSLPTLAARQRVQRAGVLRG